MQQSLRSFWAFALPAEIKAALTQVQADLRPHYPYLKWVRPENMHLTLHFLGEMSPDDLVKISNTFREACQDQAPIKLCLGRLGVFPAWSNPRVLWIDLQGQVEALAKLADKTAQSLRRLGYKTEERRFTPHITLARIGENSGSNLNIEPIRQYKLAVTLPFILHGLTLYSSQLTKNGPIYTPREIIRLD